MQLPLDALARRIIYCQIVHENRLGDQLIDIVPPASGILEAYSTGTQGLSGFGVLIGDTYSAASASGKPNNIVRISA